MCVYNVSVLCAFFHSLRVAIVSVVCKQCVHGSMRKAKSLSECRLLRVRRSGSRRSSLGKRAVSSGRWRVISERRARVRPSCSCSTAWMSEMPERSEGQSGCQSGCQSEWCCRDDTVTKYDFSEDYVHILTCGNQHHSHKESHLIRLEVKGRQLLTEFKHCIQQRAHTEGPQGGQRVCLAIQERHCVLLSIKQSAEPHHQNLYKQKRKQTNRSKNS